MDTNNLWDTDIIRLSGEKMNPFVDPRKLVYNVDDRRIFIGNRICKLLYEKYDGDLDKIIKAQETKRFMEEFDDGDLITNMYELAHPYIPLFFYHSIIQEIKGFYNEDKTEEVSQIKTNLLDIVGKICKEYY